MMRFSVIVVALVILSKALVAQGLTVRPAAPELEAQLRSGALVFQAEAGATSGDIIATAQGDYARLLAILYEAGYFSAEISIRLAGTEAAAINVLQPKQVVRPIEISIATGPRFQFGRAEVSPLPQGGTLPETFGTGQPASTATIRAASAAALSAWRDASHAKARIADQDIVAKHPSSRLDVVLRVAPGPALRFGTLKVPQNSGVRPERLRTISGLPEGAPYHPDDLERVRKRLLATGAFNAVVLREAETPNPDGTLDVDLSLTEAPPRRIGFGAQIEQRAGLSFEAFWLKRNAFGGAERLRFDLDVDGVGGDSGGIDFSIGGSLSIPGFRRADDTLRLFASAERLNEVAFETSFAEIGAQRARSLRDGDLTIGVGLKLRYADTKDAQGSRQFRHIVGSWDATLDERDDRLDPTKGRFYALSIEPFVGLADDSGTGVRLTGDARAYRSLGTGTVLAGRLQFGAVAGSTLLNTPPEFLFFSGGGGTVRGQSFQSLGVNTASGLMGGRGFLGASAELRRALSDTIGVVGFLDVGYVSEDSDFSGGESHAGVGLGLRYFTPLGPIRADIGVPLGRKSDDNFGLFIGIGQAF